jgi:hypothetical protein
MLIAALTVALAAAPRSATSDTFTSAGVGVVHALAPDRPHGLALVLSGDGGWKPEEASGRTAQALAKHGVLSVGVDVNQVFSEMGRSAQGTYDLGGALARLASTAKARYAVSGPVMLSGYSAGATLAYAAFVQSPPGRFSSLLTEGFCPDQVSPRPVGGGSGDTIAYRKWGVAGWIYRPARSPGRWALIEGAKEHPCPGGDVSRFVRSVPQARLWTIAGLSHGFGPQAKLAPTLSAAIAWTQSQ